MGLLKPREVKEVIKGVILFTQVSSVVFVNVHVFLEISSCVFLGEVGARVISVGFCCISWIPGWSLVSEVCSCCAINFGNFASRFLARIVFALTVRSTCACDVQLLGSVEH